VADDEAIVIFARVARTRQELTEVVIAALEEIENPEGVGGPRLVGQVPPPVHVTLLR
jgi:hypothetical protein